MKESTESQAQEQTTLQKEGVLILFNDEVNSFDFVIDVLCTVCDHTEEQAEQCAWITHYKGKCQVFSGSYEELSAKATLMGDVGLTVEIH
jgi:ATP-dependent Clp protease adaptor protein ClpS